MRCGREVNDGVLCGDGDGDADGSRCKTDFGICQYISTHHIFCMMTMLSINFI